MSDCIHWHFMLSTEIINSIFTQLTDTGGIYVLPLCRDHLAFWVKAWNADRTLESSFARAHDRMDQLIVFANNMELNCDFVTLPVYEVHTAANTIGMVIVPIVCVCVCDIHAIKHRKSHLFRYGSSFIIFEISTNADTFLTRSYSFSSALPCGDVLALDISEEKNCLFAIIPCFFFSSSLLLSNVQLAQAQKCAHEWIISTGCGVEWYVPASMIFILLSKRLLSYANSWSKLIVRRPRVVLCVSDVVFSIPRMRLLFASVRSSTRDFSRYKLRIPCDVLASRAPLCVARNKTCCGNELKIVAHFVFFFALHHPSLPERLGHAVF